VTASNDTTHDVVVRVTVRGVVVDPAVRSVTGSPREWASPKTATGSAAAVRS
jgi:hypothetical protein